jgi:hypothetical protein
MKTNQMTDSVMIAHLRARADEYNQIADRMENGTTATKQTRKRRTLAILPDPGPFSVENVRKVLKMRGHRASDLATRFKVPVRKVNKIVADPKSGLVVGTRGWIKAKRA